MTTERSLDQVLDVLEARVQLLRAKMSTEMRLKDDLRARQLAIVEQEEDVIDCLADHSVEQPTLFKLGELRLKKLVEDQHQLQAVLAKAGIQRLHVQDQLREALRRKLATEFARAKLEKNDPTAHSAEWNAQVLFELRKRRQ